MLIIMGKLINSFIIANHAELTPRQTLDRLEIITQGVNIVTKFGINLFHIPELRFQMSQLLIGSPDM
jgi:hypothetical protein